MTASTSWMNTSEQVQPLGANEYKQRSIDSRAGRALEILAHAIEYLTDESYFNECSTLNRKGELEAIEILMSRNREIYFSCPIVPSFGERLRKWLNAAMS